MQFCTEIRHITGPENILADTLSRINDIQQQPIDFITMDAEQVTDIQLSEFLSNSDTSLKLQHLQIGPDVKLNCDVSAKKV